ncbi:MAG: PadR family transcriptional regulator [bacterium]|nr:PadR family transcriptional regulator [bacterium]
MSSSKKTRYLILGLLSESPLTGYEIKKIVDLRFAYFWSESYGQIYPELNKMNEEGVIHKLENPESTKGRNSYKYEITSEGLEELKEWLECPVEKEVIRYEILLKLYFSNMGSTDTIMEQIKEFQMTHKKQQHLFELFQKDLEENFDEHDNHAEVLMVLMFGQKVWAAYDEWCQEALKLLQKRKELTKGDFDEERN